MKNKVGIKENNPQNQRPETCYGNSSVNSENFGDLEYFTLLLRFDFKELRGRYEQELTVKVPLRSSGGFSNFSVCFFESLDFLDFLIKVLFDTSFGSLLKSWVSSWFGELLEFLKGIVLETSRTSLFWVIGERASFSEEGWDSW